MNTLTVNYGGARITVRRATVLDNLNRYRLARKCVSWALGDEELDAITWRWCTVITRTTELVGIDYRIPSIINTDDELHEAFDKFLLLDDELVELWVAGANQVNKPLNDEKFAPSDNPDPKP